MARRMFSPKITNTDSFLDMPVSARELYFQLGMNADDDGFITPRKVLRMIGASEDDLKVLIAKNFVIPFNSGVIVITAWKINNLVRKDWYQETIYKEEKKMLETGANGEYRLVNEMLTNSLTQVRLGKDRLVKVSKEKYSSLENIKEEDLIELSNEYRVPIGFVKLKFETLKNYCESKGRTYKNYKSALRNFILGDMQREIQRPRKGGVVDATNI